MVRYAEIVEAVDKTKILDTLKANFKIDDNVYIDDEGLITVYGHCSLIKKVAVMPVKFKEVKGKFDCSANLLTSLQGSPQKVHGSFYCAENNLTSLEGGPTHVDGNFLCDSNGLKSLKGAPLSVGGSFNCAYNNLTTLQGAPTTIGGSFNCYDNSLTSLDGLPNSFILIHLDWNESLPLLRLVGKEVTLGTMFDVEKIINKYVGHGTRANIIACQKELIDAGFEGNASW